VTTDYTDMTSCRFGNILVIDHVVMQFGDSEMSVCYADLDIPEFRDTLGPDLGTVICPVTPKIFMCLYAGQGQKKLVWCKDLMA